MKKLFALVLVVMALFVTASCRNEKPAIRFTVRSGVVSAALNDVLVPKFKEAKILEKYGLDFDINVDAITGGYGDLRKAIIYDIGSKNAPDMVIGYPDHFAEYFSGAALVNLQQYIENEDYGYTDEEMADFVESYLNENRGFNASEPNALYGLPFNKSTEVFIYNKTAFEVMFGENYMEKIPTTWKQVKELSLEIIDKVKAGALDNTFVEEVTVAADGSEVTKYLKVSDYIDNSKAKFYPFGYDSSDNAFITLLRQFGGTYTEKEKINKGYVVYNEAENKEVTSKMLTYFTNMASDGLFANATTFNGDYCSDAFKIMRCLMTVGSSAGIGYNAASNSKYDYELGVAPIPYYDEGEVQTPKYVIQQGTNVAMLNQNTEEERLACWLFIKFLLEPENTAAFAIQTGGYLPVRKSAYDTEVYKEFLDNPTDDKLHYSQVAHTALDYLGKGYTFFVDDAFVGSAKIREESGKVFDSIVILGEDQQKRIQQALNTLGAAFVKIK